MATFNAIDLGPFAKVRPKLARVDLQLSSFPGVNGLAMLRMGDRGMISTATGLCVGTTGAALAATELTFMSMQQAAVLGPLVDTLGRTWPNVVLVDFEPGEDVWTLPGWGYGREYTMTFLHLTTS